MLSRLAFSKRDSQVLACFWLARWLAGFFGWLVLCWQAWMAVWFVGWLGCLVCWLAGLAGWADWFIVWLAGLADWFVG